MTVLDDKYAFHLDLSPLDSGPLDICAAHQVRFGSKTDLTKPRLKRPVPTTMTKVRDTFTRVSFCERKQPGFGHARDTFAVMVFGRKFFVHNDVRIVESNNAAFTSYMDSVDNHFIDWFGRPSFGFWIGNPHHKRSGLS